MESIPASPLDRRAKTGLTAGILLLITLYGFVSSFSSVVMNRVVDTYSLTGGAQGIMTSMISLGCIAAYLIAPVLQGRVNKAKVLTVSVALMALCFLLLGVTRRYGAMIAVCVALGVGFGWADTFCNSIMVDLGTGARATRLGILHGGFGVGSLLSPLVITALMAVITWRQISLAMCALVVLCGFVFVILRAVFFPRYSSTAEEFRLSGAAVRGYLFRRRSIWILLAGFLYAATQTGLAAWLVRYMTLRYDAETLGSTALSIYWICVTVSRFAAPRIPMRPLKLFLYGVLASVVFQTIGVLSGSAIVMCVMSGLVGLVTGLCIPMLVAENAAGQEGNTSLATSMLLVTMCFARILVPIVMGSISSEISVSFSMLLPAFTAALSALFAFLTLRIDAKNG